MPDNAKHECSVCGLKFSRIHEKLIHWTQTHDKGQVQRENRRLRAVSCWRCAKEMPPSAEGFRCECGFVLPPKAQFVEMDRDNATD